MTSERIKASLIVASCFILPSSFASATPSLLNFNQIELIPSIQVESNYQVNADLLCQDGKSVYFKDQSACYRSELEASEQDVAWEEHYSCESDLFVAPLSEVQELRLNAAKSVFRYFAIPTEYTVQVFSMSSQDALLSLVRTEKRKIPFCPKRTHQNPETVVSVKADLSPELRELLSDLDKQGISIIESSPDDIKKMADWAKKNSKDPVLGQKGDSLKLISPLCNPEVRDHLVDLNAGGGERSGGWSVVKPEELQGTGRGMTISRRPGSEPKGPIYEVVCD
jgi:hypothetical protein